MKLREIKTFGIIILLIFSFLQTNAQSLLKRDNLFDFGWRFHRGGAEGAEKPDFDDTNWRKLDLPHDYSIEDLPGTNSPFNIDAISQGNGGFTTGGTGWYRKTFLVPLEYKKKHFYIMFEGVYMNAEIWLNGKLIGRHPYGYSSFWFDVTEKMLIDQENILCVKVMNEGENSRWYSGSGIYRHVWLSVVSPIHIEPWGTYVTTSEVTEKEALINIKTTVVNYGSENSNIKLHTKIININTLLQLDIESENLIDSGTRTEIAQDIRINNPSYWSVDSPSLYKAVSEIFEDGILLERVETKFGIRSISYDVVNGFLLNGKTILLKGGSVHHDNGPLGSVAYDRAEERRVELLKASGFNAIRTAHNPPSPAFLDACDRLGMLVIDEAFDMWMNQKKSHDYHLFFKDWWKEDIENMVLRDRNHPSIIMWSTGNEIPHRGRDEVDNAAKMLTDYIRVLDPTRPITSAIYHVGPDGDPYFTSLDIAGHNYPGGFGKRPYDDYLNRYPERVMYVSESFPSAAFESWMDVLDNNFIIGDFVWTAFDYIGEVSIGWLGHYRGRHFFPWNLAYVGDIDICGWKRPQSYYRDVLWLENQISIWIKPPQPSFSFEPNPEKPSWCKWQFADLVDDWNWQGREGTEMELNVYSSCEQIELFLNGKSLGRKPTNRDTKFTAVWQVPYQPGSLKAIGYKGIRQLSSSELHTAGKTTQMNISADRTEIIANGQDLSFITIELTDSNDVRNPKADNLLSFEIEGPGTIVGVGNSNPVSLESYKQSQRKAWKGKALVIIKSEKQSGKINLKVTSSGISPGEIGINSLDL